ncbi:L-serine ammonia-lyase [Candidatus Sulfidibacterium hydrothermale]|uniref:L-serine ammonia-lyase n=1 Tax=Candidatus Sulfidibacterium hydrothermale TaxID=2875962 RepID=UPI001F0ACF52|nr:L-serine ammonia-lyase [Candidatus Sulfidibacterium hydrothermale]UBM61877.1 L-serine ammonia-lyase [Candidatus Sulfidibacterium hydrothermale]
MESIKEIFRIGRGPSSSHTMGPVRAAKRYRKRHPEARSFRVTLYGSLALTGKGHLTDVSVMRELEPAHVEIVWKKNESKPFHPNALTFEVADAGQPADLWLVYSVGGGKIVDEQTKDQQAVHVYSQENMQDVLDYYKKTGKTFWELVFETEGDPIRSYLAQVWEVMKSAIEKGLKHEGLLPGGLKLQRKAASYYAKSLGLKDYARVTSRIFSYALAVAEENASGGEVVTAPTCGSAGILPAVLKMSQEHFKISDEKVIRALATAGLIGNIVKHNASISGAEVGCQGEVGTACAMAAAAATQIGGGTPAQIEYAAEMGLEHHLGLTCDPVNGLVQIPCIERNVHAAVRAFDAARYSILSDGRHFISFDTVTRVMKQTGKDLPSLYKETSLGGLAVFGDKDFVDN